MKNSLLSAAAFLAAAALCAAPAIAQQTTEANSPSSPPVPTVAAPQQEAASPGIRIVRLSQVTGEVHLDRKTGHGFENAFANLPITQGDKLITGDGVAEVEFEDNSSLRLTPHSLVEFPVLSLGSDGIRTSTVHVSGGMVYVSLTKSKESKVSLTFGHETLALSPAAHIELALNGKQPRLDVLDGTVEAVNGATTTTVGRKKALLFDPAGSSAPTLLSKNEKGQYDAWDKQAVEYHQRLAPTNGQYASIPYAYGLADMNYYGGFTSMGGCGTMWRPYLASANWSPYSNGVWAWYPDAGYSWVSPYPWGWTAFHSGSWNYCAGGGGWGWQPNGEWNGLQNTAAVTQHLPGRLNQLRPPLGKPRPVGPTMVAVNEKPLVASKLNGQDSFVFRKDSAGLGVPRATFGKLDHISAGVAQHGTVEKPVFFASSPTASEHGNVGAAATNRGNTGSHTMPAGSRAYSPSQSSSGSHSTSSASAQSMASSASMGSMGGGHMGGGPSGGSPSGGGHH